MCGKKDISSRFLAFYINWKIILGILRGIFISLLGIEERYFTYLNIIVSLILCLGAIKISFKNKNKLRNFAIPVGFILAFLCILTLLITPGVLKIFLKSLFFTISQVIIIILIFLYIDDMDQFLKANIPYIPLSIFYAIVQWVVQNKVGAYSYSMEFSYWTIVPALLVFVLILQKYQLKYCIYFLILFLINLKVGSRGSLICYMIAFIFVVFIFQNIKHIITRLCIFIPCVVILLLNLKNIFEKIAIFFPGSRTIQLFADGQFFYLSGREKHYHFIMNSIFEKPMEFRGLYSDRIYLSKYFNIIDPSDIYGVYSHNFFLEIIFQFGILIGVGILLAIIFMIIKTIHIVNISNNNALKNLYIVFASYAIGQLLFSSSYLISISFGMYMGIIVWIYKNKNKIL